MSSINNKAQMEMIGLVVIVILITLGLLFMTIFALKDDGIKVFTQKGIAASTMAALMKTTINDCNQPKLSLEKKILDDCAKNKDLPEDFYTFHCKGKNSCEYLEENIALFLNETLGLWGFRYQYESALLKGDVIIGPIISSRGGCEAKKLDRETSNPFFLSSGERLVRSELFICG